MRYRAPAAALITAFALLTSPTPAHAQTVSTVEPIQISIPNGPKLNGKYRDGGPGAPGVLLFPMCSDSGEDGWAPVAAQLQKAGVSSLMVEEAGYSDREARGDAALAFLRSRVGANAPVAITGGSCGVALAAGTATRNPEQVRALVLLSGPHTADHVAFVSKTPSLAVFSGASDGEPPSPEWARELKKASANPASHAEIWTVTSHGTDYFIENPAFASQISDWLVKQLKR